MHVRTRELLYFMLWSAEKLSRPTLGNITESYESWAWRNHLLGPGSRLEQQKLVERKGRDARDRSYRLTAEGQRQALGGRNPPERWARRWDGHWRLAVFDIPVSQDEHRQRLRRYLRERHFGCLQHSVWITPDPMEEEIKVLKGGRINARTFVLLEAQAIAGERGADLVTTAWDFKKINSRYEQYLKVLAHRPQPTDGKREKNDSTSLAHWTRIELESWKRAVHLDPLLPESLLPREYAGKEAWQKKISAMAELTGNLIRQPSAGSEVATPLLQVA